MNKKERILQGMSSEELMERCLQKIFEDISCSEDKGRIEMRDAALRAKVLAEATLTEVRLRRVGLSMMSEEEAAE